MKHVLLKGGIIGICFIIITSIFLFFPGQKSSLAYAQVAPNDWHVTLGKGNQGSAVRFVQAWLYQAGYHIMVDGKFGPQTEKAVLLFQSNHLLVPVDGVVGNTTFDELVPILKKGDQGPAVAAMQDYLNFIGCGPLDNDGIFGPITEKAVECYQTLGGAVNSDGIAGLDMALSEIEASKYMDINGW